MFSKGQRRDLAATDGTLKPGDYAIGSPQSRAAARAKLEQHLAGRERMDLVVVTIGRRLFAEDHYLGKWEERDGKLSRMSMLPSGLSTEEADRIVAEFGARNIAKEWNMRQMQHAPVTKHANGS